MYKYKWLQNVAEEDTASALVESALKRSLPPESLDARRVCASVLTRHATERASTRRPDLIT